MNDLLTDEAVRQRFGSLQEPEALDADAVLGAAKGRKTRRDVLRLGSGAAAVGALAGLTWLGWGRMDAHAPQPAGTPSGPTGPATAPQTNAPAPTVETWPIKDEPALGVLYRIDGNIGLRMRANDWEMWDLTDMTSIKIGTWAAQAPAAAMVANCETAVTDSDGYNYWATVVPDTFRGAEMKLKGNGKEVVVSANSLPRQFASTLVYWRAHPGEVEANGPFVMDFATTDSTAVQRVEIDH